MSNSQGTWKPQDPIEGTVVGAASGAAATVGGTGIVTAGGIYASALATGTTMTGSQLLGATTWVTYTFLAANPVVLAGGAAAGASYGIYKWWNP
eukprot:CAMPEP_0201567314 /NCGR_PEP_ID=MMETSP0190_2-20130828/7776_1 /ASSEMBLY_ACC=CAM_ASM_000263 /TAXON_ID=37353 /ORGANISM="Rosalina sp." /LENGTH=93 /DNA_ID=CAMNT_0047987165 /DNA_START=99 /DNA_END=380 /DNA_ORIENTATION=+